MKAPASHHYWIVCDKVFDPHTRSTNACFIEVKEGCFASVLPLEGRPGLPAEAEVMDLTGHTLLSPLVDPHTHAYMNPWPLDPDQRTLPGTKDFETELTEARERLVAARLAGLNLVRDLGDPLGINVALAREARGNPALPRVLAAGPGLYREGRYGRFIGHGVENAEHLYAEVRRLAADPDIQLIKLVPTGIINFRKGRVTSEPQFSADELKQAVAIAHDAGKAVVAHGSGEAGLRLAVEAGIDFIEHGYFISRETMDLLGEKGLIWTPTFAPVQAQWAHAACCRWDAETTAHLRRILDEHAAILRYAHEAGVKIMGGSDAGSPGVGHGGGLIRELEIMGEAGLPAAELLANASHFAASWIDPRGPDRGIAPGQPADFIAVAGNPHHRIGDLVDVAWVARAGVVEQARRPRMETDPDAEDYGPFPQPPLTTETTGR